MATGPYKGKSMNSPRPKGSVRRPAGSGPKPSGRPPGKSVKRK